MEILFSILYAIVFLVAAILALQEGGDDDE